MLAGQALPPPARAVCAVATQVLTIGALHEMPRGRGRRLRWRPRPRTRARDHEGQFASALWRGGAWCSFLASGSRAFPARDGKLAAQRGRVRHRRRRAQPDADGLALVGVAFPPNARRRRGGRHAGEASPCRRRSSRRTSSIRPLRSAATSLFTTIVTLAAAALAAPAFTSLTRKKLRGHTVIPSARTQTGLRGPQPHRPCSEFLTGRY